MSLDLVTIIFGMKVRQARQEAGLTLSDLARQCDLSPSYLTEIEKGRKYPRADKIMKMAEALGKSYDELVSIKLAPSLRYLETALSSVTIRHFPFEEFGLETTDVFGLLTREPERASALLHAILEIIRHYDLREEDFIRAALRSYQEIHENYFPELEEAALSFTADYGRQYGFSEQSPPTLATVESILQQEYRYRIDTRSMAAFPALAGHRSVMTPGELPVLYLNNRLYTRQSKFILARELGYQYLDLRDRSHTSPPDRADSFDQLLNDMKASYFAGALLMPRAGIVQELQQFFSQTDWNPSPLTEMLTSYDVTPEMLLYRFSELIPESFGVKLHFLRFHHATGSRDYQLVKQLNMNQLLVPSGIGLNEHYCRRWLSVRLLAGGESGEDPMPVGVQLSEFLETQERFLCLGFGRRMVLTPQISSSVIVGFRVDTDLRRVVRFLDDPVIPHVVIHETCERCPLTVEQCGLRAAPPALLDAQREQRARKTALDQLQARSIKSGLATPDWG